MGSNFASAQYADWLYDASRKAGDVTLAENDRSDSFVYNYYVVQFDSRARDESSTADVRHILIGAGSNPTEEQYAAAEESAQAMLDQWKAEGGTEDAFALLAMENTADSGSQATRRPVHRRLQRQCLGPEFPGLGPGPRPSERRHRPCKE